MKLGNPYFPGNALFMCAGLGEWGTSGAAWFLARHWRDLSCRFGSNPFFLVLRVSIGSDHSAVVDIARGQERLLWRLRMWAKDALKLRAAV
jgi:hypothetical protein